MNLNDLIKEYISLVGKEDYDDAGRIFDEIIDGEWTRAEFHKYLLSPAIKHITSTWM